MLMSQLLFFKGRNCKEYKGDIFVNGSVVKFSDTAVHLGHQMSISDSDASVKCAIGKFWKSFNMFMADFGHVYSSVKCKLFHQYCCSYYGAPLWNFNSAAVEGLCIAWRKALRILFGVSNRTHCHIIELLAGKLPLKTQMIKRFVKFYENCSMSDNAVIKSIVALSRKNPLSTSGNMIRCYVQEGNILPDLIPKYNDNVMSTINVLDELIQIRDGQVSCDAIDFVDCEEMILDICIN